MPIALVVEDEWLVRMEIADAFQDNGWTVLEAATGEASLTFSLTHIDLLVTDIRLPGRLNGWDVADAFRAANCAVAVIYCSGNSADPTRVLPGSIFFSKPCRTDILIRAAASLCAAGSAGPSLRSGQSG